MLRTTFALLLATTACSSGAPSAAEPEATATAAAPETAAALATAPSQTAASATADGSAAPAPTAPAGKEWTIGEANAKGVTVTNDLGEAVKLDTLSWTLFRRQTAPLASTEVSGANVSFATVTANGATAKEVVCKLPPWADLPEGAAIVATTMVGLAAGDAMPVSSLLKAKAALSKCAPGKTVRVQWIFEASKHKTVETTGVDKTSSQCLAKAISSLPAFYDGACAATLEL